MNQPAKRAPRRHTRRGPAPRTAFAIAAALFVFACAAPVSAAGPEPSTLMSPADVVRAQMNALKANDAADSGIETAFRFASPANKAMTGPLERFAAMIRNPLYAPMLNHRRAQYENYKVRGEAATLDVIVESAEGKLIGYRFSLSRQHGNAYEGSWMTDGVQVIKMTTL